MFLHKWKRENSALIRMCITWCLIKWKRQIIVVIMMCQNALAQRKFIESLIYSAVIRKKKPPLNLSFLYLEISWKLSQRDVKCRRLFRSELQRPLLIFPLFIFSDALHRIRKNYTLRSGREESAVGNNGNHYDWQKRINSGARGKLSQRKFNSLIFLAIVASNRL